MPRFVPPHGFVLSTLALLLLSHPTHISAQRAEEIIALRPGGIFEIYADTVTPDPKISWVFSKGSTFVQADRGPLFSIRPTEEGEYFLTGEVADAQDTPLRKLFKIQMRADAPIISQSDTEGDTLVRVSPTPNETNMSILRGEQRVVRLDIIHPDIEQLALDINAEKDQSNDGDPFNDNILTNSVFKSGRGSLHIWLTPRMLNQTFLLVARLKTGALVTQKIQVISEDYEEILKQKIEQEEQARRDRTTIESKLVGERTYRLSVDAEDGVITETVFHHWDFGDGTQSLIDEPEHQFPESRMYQVRVSVRDAYTGKEILLVQKPFEVSEGTMPEITEQTPGKEAMNPEAVQESAKQTSYIVATVIKALVILAISIGIGILAVFLFAKMKGKSLQKSFEEAEKKLVKEPGTRTPPLQLEKQEEEKKEEEDEREKEKEKEKAPLETPEINRQVPSWLAPSPQISKAGEKGGKAPLDTSVPPPPPPPPIAQKTTTSEHIPGTSQSAVSGGQGVPQAAAQTPTGGAPVPPWLQGAVTTPAKAAQPLSSETPQTRPTASEQKTTPTSTGTATPPWLVGAQTLEERHKGSTPTEPASASPATPKTELPAPAKNEASVPPWLQQTPTPPPPAAAEQKMRATTPPPAPSIQHAENTPPWLQGAGVKTTTPATNTPRNQGGTSATGNISAQKNQTGANTGSTSQPPLPPTTNQTSDAIQVQQAADSAAAESTHSKEERERERKRRKRQRYRANKRTREQEGEQTQVQAAPAPTESPAVKDAPPPKKETQTPPWLQHTPPSSKQTQETIPPPSPPAPPAQRENASVPPWLQGVQAQSTQKPPANFPPSETPPATKSTPLPPPPPQGNAPIPEWLKGTSAPTPPPPTQQPIQQTGSDDDVKFVISADSVEGQPPQPHTPGDAIPPAEKQGE